MKKIIALLLALLLCFSLCSCIEEDIKLKYNDDEEKAEESKGNEDEEVATEEEVVADEVEEETSEEKEVEEELAVEEITEEAAEEEEAVAEEEPAAEEEDEDKETKKKDKSKKKKTEEVAIYDKIEGTISETNKSHEYELNLSESGRIAINFKGKGIESVYLKIYDEDGQEFWSEDPWWNRTSKQISYKDDVYLASGIYKFTVSKYYGTGDYELSISFKSSGESFHEEHGGSNNDFDEASEIELDSTYWGQLAINDIIDNYMFTLDESGCVSVNYKAQNIESVYLKIYDEDGQEFWSENPWWNGTSKQISFKADIELTSGTYFFSVSKYSRYGDYEVGFDFTASEESFEEEQWGSDNTFDDANEITIGKKYSGQLAVNDKIDNYVFEIDEDKNVGISLKANDIEACYIKIYDEDGQEFWSKNPWWNNTSKQISYEDEVALEAGVYYISVSPYSRYGNYELKLS